jgi:hypothetical protein
LEKEEDEDDDIMAIAGEYYKDERDGEVDDQIKMTSFMSEVDRDSSLHETSPPDREIQSKLIFGNQV